MTIILYCMPFSSAARSVDLVLHALDLEAEHKQVDLSKGDQLTPEFLKMNPLHTIPVIDDDGFILWESRAIMTYLVSKYGKDDSLYPKDLQKRAIVDQRLHYNNDIFALMKQIGLGCYFHGKRPTEEVLQKARECQDNVEKLLEGQLFMAGDSLTVADYSYITIMINGLDVFCPLGDKHSNIKAWAARCEKTMKDFDKVNTEGANYMKKIYQEKWALAK